MLRTEAGVVSSPEPSNPHCVTTSHEDDGVRTSHIEPVHEGDTETGSTTTLGHMCSMKEGREKEADKLE
jgi:hypothetical protein